MAIKMKVDKRSLAEVTRNMNSAIALITKQSRAGLIAAGINILGSSLKKTPVDKANLKSSGTVIWDKSKPNSNTFESPKEQMSTQQMEAQVKSKLKANLAEFDVAVGYGASYSVFVHENMTNQHPNGGQAKFLQTAIDEELPNTLKLIKNYAKIK